MVGCLFARKVYTRERLQEALEAVGLRSLAESMDQKSRDIQSLRWSLKFRTGYDPSRITIPERLRNVRNWKGAVDQGFLDDVCRGYQQAVRHLASGYSEKP